MYPPRDPAEMGLFAAALVRRYGPGGAFWVAHPAIMPLPIHSWQVWNEPNIPAFWATGPDAAAYVRLLDAVGTAIHAADPAAEVVVGGLPYVENGPSIGAFVDAMYAAGARGTFDTMAIHPYASSPAAVVGILRSVRDRLDRLGDPDRPIWATELGWATGGPPVTITTSEGGQARLLSEAIGLMQRARDALRLRGFVAFRWRDVPPNPGQTDVWALHTGLLREDGTAKPALGAFRDAADAWLQAPAAGTSPGADPSASADRRPGAGGPDAVPGVSRRTLKIRRWVARGRLHVLVDVPPGGGTRRVQIVVEAVRAGRVAGRWTRRVATSRRVARAIFRLGPRTRSAGLLRVSARHGDARAARTLRLRR
jgi:hypothetical protein